jgi:hypothetical protein
MEPAGLITALVLMTIAGFLIGTLSPWRFK